MGLGLFGGITASLVSRVPQKIANEFLMLGEPLSAQRAYEVNSKSIQTSDEMLQSVAQMKR